jgi:hypothetical protein
VKTQPASKKTTPTASKKTTQPVSMKSDAGPAKDQTDPACANDPVGMFDGLHEHLECAGLFSDIRKKTLAQGVEPFAPGVALWADGADRHRWIVLPKGTKIDASNPNEWSFPVGTNLFEEFQVGGHRIETRLFQKASDRWVRTTYQWNSDETSATRSVGGDITLNDGSTYHLPPVKECDQCHQGRIDRVLGFEQIALGLSDATGLTLAKLVEKGLISPVPERTNLQIADDDTGKAAPAISWLHINCGVACHNANPGAAAHSTRLRMRLDATELDGRPATMYETLRSTIGVAATSPQWDGQTRIVPGSPEKSLLFHLMSSRGGAENEQMPPIASSVVDKEAVSMVEQWIRSMPAPPRPLDAGASEDAGH